MWQYQTFLLLKTNKQKNRQKQNTKILQQQQQKQQQQKVKSPFSGSIVKTWFHLSTQCEKESEEASILRYCCNVSCLSWEIARQYTALINNVEENDLPKYEEEEQWYGPSRHALAARQSWRHLHHLLCRHLKQVCSAVFLWRLRNR